MAAVGAGVYVVSLQMLVRLIHLLPKREQANGDLAATKAESQDQVLGRGIWCFQCALNTARWSVSTRTPLRGTRSSNPALAARPESVLAMSA